MTPSEQNAIRQAAERRIISRLLKDAFARGYHATLSYGDDLDPEPELLKTTDRLLILRSMWAAAEEKLYFHDHGTPMGWVLVVHGNHPSEVIADYTNNLDSIVNTPQAMKLNSEIENIDFA